MILNDNNIVLLFAVLCMYVITGIAIYEKEADISSETILSIYGLIFLISATASAPDIPTIW